MLHVCSAIRPTVAPGPRSGIPRAIGVGTPMRASCTLTERPVVSRGAGLSTKGGVGAGLGLRWGQISESSIRDLGGPNSAAPLRVKNTL